MSSTNSQLVEILQVPRRQCAKLMGMKDKELTIHVGACKPGELVSG
jgi:hypothetical protein